MAEGQKKVVVSEETWDNAQLGLVAVEGRASNVNLNHNPDKALAVNVPFLKVTQEEVFKSCRGEGYNKEPLIRHTNWWTKDDPLGGHMRSKTIIEVQATIRDSGETLTVPMETGATIMELSHLLAYKTGVDPGEVGFISKQGCSFRRMYPSDQIRPKLAVVGLESFSKTRTKYKYPKAVIGAGHIGLKTAMILLKKKDTDFVIFDRMSRVGGTSWMYQANTTSKLQTEFGAYHLEFDVDNPLPTMFNSPWPSRNRLLQHFHAVSEEYGILPYCKFSTNVKDMNLFDISGAMTKMFSPAKWYMIDKYQLTTETIEVAQLHHGRFQPRAEAKNEAIFDSSAIFFYPGNLTIPREETYKNEDQFEGEIGYGMFDEVDYGVVPGKDAVIVGHGAFAVENVRTCCEYGANKCYIVCRRKNIACPRAVSWLANRSLNPLTCVSFLNFMKPMYDFLGWDVWEYYAVSTNEKRTTCMIQQKARFGIGDIYFLSQYMGKLEVVIEPKGVKKLSRHTVHLDSGRKLENVTVILKLLGFVGELENDRLMKIKEMAGFWVNEDPRRYLVAEPVSVMANNMGGTSLSPGALNWSVMGIYFIHHPQDFVGGVVAAGMLPKHTADYGDEGTPRPAYVVDARHGTSTGMSVTIYTPHLAQECSFDGVIKAVKHRLCHPVSKFLAAAKEDWDYYAHKFLAEGFGTDKPYPEYPYNVEFTKGLIFHHMQETNEPMLTCDYEDLGMQG
uniref:Flavin-containing monooxygenase n=1 Tax=Alexandrium catenella TaxID=2925 RepID=A0A7S1R284_ALECA|mmetsp:Transcript_43466/g.117217  ORF Transcript_43466/g.117217 Transcript_43466/m.117217 type:complete len:729 (+) Transcript_43466:181-2367(+)